MPASPRSGRPNAATPGAAGSAGEAARRADGGVTSLPVPVVRLDPDLPLPAYARRGDAGVDLIARHDAVIEAGGGRALVATGIAVAIPDGHAGFVLPRSGLALRHGVTLANSPGLIDAGYRDELAVVLLNTDPHRDFHLSRGDRMAQLVVQAVASVRWQVVADLGVSDRAGGFGHTGV